MFGRCTAPRCSWRGRLVRHHVVYEQHVRAAGGDPWDQANAMLLGTGCTCHADHHSGKARLPVWAIPQTAMDFAIELLGTDRAALYIARYYRTDDPRRAT